MRTKLSKLAVGGVALGSMLLLQGCDREEIGLAWMPAEFRLFFVGGGVGVGAGVGGGGGSSGVATAGGAASINTGSLASVAGGNTIP